MTSGELVEQAVRKLPLGHPAVSMAIHQENFWHDYLDTPYHGLGGIGYQRLAAMLETVLDELPDVPPRTGDCAELLAD